ncbi:DUF1697 domain-containing protein [Pseudooceanicola onchidii]|uniref:DUF1697 domain-containing protein n=1 Tax=Pseudooceanicola onchidii TaxID=2562279 RepID=UPI0010AA508E|nr:DUF1697 domain-containing protein [Pseudooceanicola onchidii]
MTRWIVLLRGINVGGHGKTPMAVLREALTEAGAEQVATYIQSGNLVFDHPGPDPRAMADWTSALIEKHFHHRPPALAFTAQEMSEMDAANPFPDDADPRRLHYHLFRDPPAADALSRLTPLLYHGEELRLSDHCLYHWPPAGIGTSKVAQKIATALGVTTTARNRRTIRALCDMA